MTNQGGHGGRARSARNKGLRADMNHHALKIDYSNYLREAKKVPEGGFVGLRIVYNPLS